MAASANDVRAGGSWYELYAKDGVTGVLDRVQKRIAAFAGSVQRVGSVAAVAGAGLLAPITGLFKLSESRGAELAKLALRLGLPIEALNKLQYAADRTGASLEEVMQDATGRFSGLIAQAPPIDVAAARAAAETQKQLADASLALQRAIAPLATIVARYATKFADFAEANKGAIPTIAAVGAGLLGLGAALKVTAAAFALLIPVATAAWAAVTGPIGLGLLVGAVLGGSLFAGLAYLADGFALLKDGTKSFGETFSTTLGGIKDALAKADIALAWQILLAGLTVAWTGFTLHLTAGWNAFKDVFVDAWVVLVASAKVTWTEFLGWFDKTLNRIVSGFALAAQRVAEAIPGGEGLAGSLGAFREGLPSDDEIDARTRLRKRDIALDALGELGDRKRERDAALAEAAKDRLKAEADLTRLRGEAAKAADDRTAFDAPTSLKQGLAGAISVKGGFSSSALNQQFGVGDNAQKQTELLKLISTGEGGLAENIAKKLAPIVGAPKIAGG